MDAQTQVTRQCILRLQQKAGSCVKRHLTEQLYFKRHLTEQLYVKTASD
jgi:hypothetical protein